jgi:hypothetical protein
MITGSLRLQRLHALVRSRAGGKGALRQWLEMTALYTLHGNGPGYYQLAGFWRLGQAWSTMTQHLSFRQYEAQVDSLNPWPYRKLSQNKVAEKAILTLMGVPTPRFIGFLHPEHGRDTSGAPLLGAEDLSRLMSNDPATRVCFKLVEGHGGRGFAAADIVRGPELRFRLLNAHDATSPGGQPRTDEPDLLSAGDLLSLLGHAPRIIEEYVDQHPAFAALNASSVNTIRFYVIRIGGKISTRLACLKIGRAGALVDNVAAGGILAAVDCETGRVSAAIGGHPSRPVYTVHPESGAQIEGIILPMFAEARSLAEQCLTVFPGMNFSGLDVAVTTKGPVVIEANVQPSRTAAALVGAPSKDMFTV